MGLSYTTDGIINRILNATKGNFFLTEDEKGIGIYSTLFEKKLLPKEFDNLNIFSSDGKSEMKKIYEELKRNGEEKKAVYLVDLDYDEYLEIEKIEDSNFFYLEKYTLENYFVTEEAGFKLIAVRNSLSFPEAKEKLNFETWSNLVAEEYKELIALFLAIRKVDIKAENAGSSTHRFFNIGEKCKIKCGARCSKEERLYRKCNTKMRDYREQIFDSLKEDDKKLIFNNKLRDFYALIQDSDNIFDNIPGKQLLELYSAYLSSFFSKKIDQDVLIGNGIYNCGELDKIIDKISHIIKES